MVISAIWLSLTVISAVTVVGAAKVFGQKLITFSFDIEFLESICFTFLGALCLRVSLIRVRQDTLSVIAILIIAYLWFRWTDFMGTSVSQEEESDGF